MRIRRIIIRGLKKLALVSASALMLMSASVSTINTVNENKLSQKVKADDVGTGTVKQDTTEWHGLTNDQVYNSFKNAGLITGKANVNFKGKDKYTFTWYKKPHLKYVWPNMNNQVSYDIYNCVYGEPMYGACYIGGYFRLNGSNRKYYIGYDVDTTTVRVVPSEDFESPKLMHSKLYPHQFMLTWTWNLLDGKDSNTVLTVGDITYSSDHQLTTTPARNFLIPPHQKAVELMDSEGRTDWFVPVIEIVTKKDAKVFTGRDVDASEFGHYQSWILKKDYDNLKKGASNGTNKITYEMGTKIQQKGNKLYSSWAKSSDMKAVKKQFAKMLKSKKQKKRIQKDIIKSANLMTRGIKEDGYRPQ